MSSPIQDFEKLSVNMASTRAQDQRARQLAESSRHRNDSGSDESEESDESEGTDEEYDSEPAAGTRPQRPPIPRIIQSPTRQKYDVSNFSPKSFKNVDDGFRGNYAVKAIEPFNRNDDSFFQFTIIETLEHDVKIGSPTSQYRNLTCTCFDRPSVGVCRHAYWLIDQVQNLTGIQELSGGQLLTLPESGSPYTAQAAFNHVVALGLKNLEKSLLNHSPERQRAVANFDSRQRLHDIQEILAALSKSGGLAESYRPDIFDKFPSHIGFEDVLVRQDLEATMARVLYKDPTMFNVFHEMLPAQICYQDIMQKLEKMALDKIACYLDSKSSARPTYDAKWCAEGLVTIIDLFHKQMASSDPPMDEETRTVAASALIHILDKVVHEKSLYVRLIESRPDKAFIVDELRNFGTFTNANFLETLKSIYEKARSRSADKSKGKDSSHSVFEGRLGDIIGVSRRVPSEGASKRYGQGGSQPNKKRMK
jgi:hypothetical protein